MAAETVLVIDDDDSLRKVTEYTLNEAGFRVLTSSSGEDGVRLFLSEKPDVVITDLRMSGMNGFDVLKRIKQEKRDTLVIVITAHGSIENAVEAMKMDAYDYITKPFSRSQLLTAVRKAFKFKALRKTDSQIPQKSSSTSAPTLIGESESMQRLASLIRKIGSSEATVLVQGESGTGKEVVARTIHHSSVRTYEPFVAVNCAAIPSELIESELFGHVKGSFTGSVCDRQGKFEQANGGTIFLDEVGDLPLNLQPKLLRVLQEREIEPVGSEVSRQVDVRVVAATNRDIEQAVAEGRFREDLYYRLAVVPVRIPPLRKRREDIGLLVRHFLSKYDRTRDVSISPEAMRQLENYDWPGNVRELENLVEQLLVLCQSDTIKETDLPPKVLLNQRHEAKGILNLPARGYSLEKLEKEAVFQALVLNDWNKSRAAEFLQIPRHVLVYRMEKYEITSRV